MSLAQMLRPLPRRRTARALGRSHRFVSDLALGKRPLCDYSLIGPLSAILGIDPAILAAQVVPDRRCAR